MSYRRNDINIEDGVPFYATLPYDLETCCDCALTHRLRYRVEDANGDPIKNAKIKITVWRDERATKERRAMPEGLTARPGFLVDVEDVKRARRREKRK